MFCIVRSIYFSSRRQYYRAAVYFAVCAPLLQGVHNRVPGGLLSCFGVLRAGPAEIVGCRLSQVFTAHLFLTGDFLRVPSHIAPKFEGHWPTVDAFISCEAVCMPFHLPYVCL